MNRWRADSSTCLVRRPRPLLVRRTLSLLLPRPSDLHQLTCTGILRLQNLHGVTSQQRETTERTITIVTQWQNHIVTFFLFVFVQWMMFIEENKERVKD